MTDSITKQMNEVSRTEMYGFQREIERSRHQMMSEITYIRAQHQFTRKSDILERKAVAMHTLRTSELELAVIAIQERLADAERLEAPHPITVGA